MPSEVKTEVDEFVQYIIGSNPQLKKLVQDYVQAKLRLVELYTSKPESLQKAEMDYRKEAEKIIANRVLGAVKTLFRIDSEMRSAEYAESRRQHYASQLLYEIFDLLSGLIDHSNADYHKHCTLYSTELSKAARNELYLKYQDKGYER